MEDRDQRIVSDLNTTYLDEVLAARDGRPFVQPSAEAIEFAAIAAAIHAATANGATGSNGQPREESRWKTEARLEGVRCGTEPRFG